jgi:hypothetical protein
MAIVVASLVDLSLRWCTGQGRRVEFSSEAVKPDSSFGMFSNFKSKFEGSRRAGY